MSFPHAKESSVVASVFGCCNPTIVVIPIVEGIFSSFINLIQPLKGNEMFNKDSLARWPTCCDLNILDLHVGEDSTWTILCCPGPENQQTLHAWKSKPFL